MASNKQVGLFPVKRSEVQTLVCSWTANGDDGVAKSRNAEARVGEFGQMARVRQSLSEVNSSIVISLETQQLAGRLRTEQRLMVRRWYDESCSSCDRIVKDDASINDVCEQMPEGGLAGRMKARCVVRQSIVM